MIRERSDLHFLFLTKRIERFMECIPADWNNGYDNVTVGCTVENQDKADHVELVVAGGESGRNGKVILCLFATYAAGPEKQKCLRNTDPGSEFSNTL